MIPVDTITRRTWAAYMEANRRARVAYAWMPTATCHSHATPCHVCRKPTQRSNGVCSECKEAK